MPTLVCDTRITLMLSNTILPDAPMSHPVSSRSFNAESVAFRGFMDTLVKEIPCAEVILLTTLPRGGLQIAQPPKVSENLLKAYIRDWHNHDEAAWKALTSGKPAKGKAGSRFTDEFLAAFGYHHVAAAAVVDPILPGYVGVLELLRSSEQGAFTSEELQRLGHFAEQLSVSLKETRASRTVIQSGSPVDVQPADVRQFVFNARGEVLFNKPAFDRLDASIRQQMVREATARSAHVTGEPVVTERLLLSDTHGDHWTANASTFNEYPALDAGPVVFFSLLPSCLDWAMLRPTDLAADAEMSRLVPAMKFMQQEFHRGPTLTEIAKTVHLSPFHFHRRFTELFGLTPKHFLLECQIHVAKSDLLTGEKELAKIASECGFAHQSHFTSRFKQATGLTPTRWRRMAATRSL
jgi:AraC-like DNA-binding protein